MKESESKVPRVVGSQRAMYQLLGITRSTFFTLSKMEGAPKVHTDTKYNVERWTRFAAQNLPRAEIIGVSPVDKKHWDTELARIRCEKTIFELDQKRGIFIHKDRVKEINAELVAELRKILREELLYDLPKNCEGMNAEQLLIFGKKTEDKICRTLSTK